MQLGHDAASHHDALSDVGALLVDRGDHHSKNDLTVTVYQKPGALMFKGTVYSDVTARVCGNCGFIELFATAHKQLLEAARTRAQND